MSKPSAFPSLVTCLFGPSRREQPENLANPLVCATASGGSASVRGAGSQPNAHNGKRPVAKATSHQPYASRAGCRRKVFAYLSSTLAPASSSARSEEHTSELH